MVEFSVSESCQRDGCNVSTIISSREVLTFMGSNVWAPETQRESLVVSHSRIMRITPDGLILVQAIATHYRFSPRLLGLMKCKPLTPQLVPSVTHHSRLDLWHMQKSRQDLKGAIQEKSIDIERDQGKIDTPPTQNEAIDLNHYTIVNEVWHYASVDWGDRCETQRNLFS